MPEGLVAMYPPTRKALAMPTSAPGPMQKKLNQDTRSLKRLLTHALWKQLSISQNVYYQMGR